MKDWETKEDDIALAKSILREHFEEAEDFEVKLEEITWMPDSDLRVERAEWLIELEDVFCKKYGDAQGDKVTRQVVTALITNGENVH